MSKVENEKTKHACVKCFLLPITRTRIYMHMYIKLLKRVSI
jgi:hypothetical protein